METKICPNCKSEFRVSKGHPQKYCKRSCEREALFGVKLKKGDSCFGFLKIDGKWKNYYD